MPAWSQDTALDGDLGFRHEVEMLASEVGHADRPNEGFRSQNHPGSFTFGVWFLGSAL